jgi:photosystem II stability/assembly factor-like uncharacterized protein
MHLLLPAVLLLFLLMSVSQARTIGRGPYVSQEFPPRRPDPLPAFSVPRSGETLDEGWSFVQFLYDADTTYPQYLNAVPVGMGFARSDSGFLATLHTVFVTTDRGSSWRNLDPAPPPRTGGSDYIALRSPTYINSLSIRPVLRDSALYDSVFLSTINSDVNTGTIRLICYRSVYFLNPLLSFVAPYWLTLVTVVDSATACALAGLDGQVYRTASLWQSSPWEHLNPDKVLIRAGRGDSTDFEDTWVSGVTSQNPLIVAVGSHHWISRNRGAKWQIRPAADWVFDNAVSFVDTLYGMTAGGTISPNLSGWAHRSTDGGRTWSGRLLEVPMPLRAVKMVTRETAFAAGGSFDAGAGGIWMTTDAGQQWSRDLSVSAEIRLLETRRVNAAYVDVFAAGAFPDFRGGIWRKRVWAPIESGAVIVADPDTLDFGDLRAGIADTMIVTLSNEGALSDTLTAFRVDTTVTRDTVSFRPVWPPETVVLDTGASVDLSVIFRSNNLGEYSASLQVRTRHSGNVEVFCRARVALESEPPVRLLLPADARLTVWPNPGNATFDVRFELSRATVASLRVFDLSGRMVETLAQASFAPGEFSRTWDASALATGIYFVRLDVEGSQGVTQKVLLVK